MLILAQEFSIDNVIVVWDTVLADHQRYSFLNFICIAMVTYRREILLKNEFGECLEILQK
jgi:TBC1 domain family member 13